LIRYLPESKAMKNDVLTIPQAAKICALNRVTIWKYVKSGDLAASVTPGGHYRIKKTDLDAFARKKGMYPLGTYQPSQNKILIVDDDPAIQKLVAHILTPHGYDTETAGDGFEAGVKVFSYKPGLVVLDLMMDEMDGFEVCKRLKKNPETQHIRILAITGYDTPANRNRILAAGADGYLAKPLDPKVLVDQVSSLVGRNKPTTHSKSNHGLH
jgi:excisionase family DNA binding protein